VIKTFRKMYEEKCIKKNKRIVAKYLALCTECSHMKKCMVTLTPYDGKLSTLIKIRQEFFKTLNKVKRYKKNPDLSIKYFSNIEFTKSRIPHIHIQLFYTNKIPIVKTYERMLCKGFINNQSNSLSFAKKNDTNFQYVIKDYLTYDEKLEKHKSKHKNINYYSCSNKSVSNPVVKYLYRQLKFKTYNKYKEILEQIHQGLVVIFSNYNEKEKFNKNVDKYQKKRNLLLQSSYKVGGKYVYIFSKYYIIDKYLNIKKGKVCTYKIKRLIKGRKVVRIKLNSKKRKIILDF